MDPYEKLQQQIYDLRSLINKQYNDAISQLNTFQQKLDLLHEISLPGEHNPAFLDTHVDDLHLSMRTRNCLCRGQFFHIRDLLRTTYSELRKIDGYGQKTEQEVRLLLNSHGIELPETDK